MKQLHPTESCLQECIRLLNKSVNVLFGLDSHFFVVLKYVSVALDTSHISHSSKSGRGDINYF